jgi:hypothetical protein
MASGTSAGKEKLGQALDERLFFGWPKETAAGEDGRSVSAGAEQRSAGAGVLSDFLFLGWPKDIAGLALCSGGSAGGGSGGRASAGSSTWILRRLAGPLRQEFGMVFVLVSCVSARARCPTASCTWRKGTLVAPAV